VIALHNLVPRSTRWVFIGYSQDHKGYCCLNLSTNRVVISRHIIFYEAYFPFVASPHLTNDYKFLSEMDSMLSPIGTRLGAGTLTTTTGSLTVPLGSLITPKRYDPSPSGSTTPPSSLTAPPGDLTTHVVDAGGQITPPNDPTIRVAEVDGPTAPSDSPTAHPTTPTTYPTPHAAQTTPPTASSVVPISPPVAQPVPRMLLVSAVPISLRGSSASDVDPS
jgi:hypothetical protein